LKDKALDPGIQALQQRLQHSFSDPELLAQALTHRSHSAKHNERLEFLGDSVLSLAVAQLLFRRLGDVPEGDLSRARASLVRQDTLFHLAVSLDLPAVIRLGEGEMRSGGHRRPSILADALEAVIGALFMDAGYATAEAFVLRLFADVDISPGVAVSEKDPKTALQEWLQGRRMRLPVYRVVGTVGAAHQQTFDVECEVTEWHLSERGIGPSRRAGEQLAAAAMLAQLKARFP
jgi:ribonuclease-3